MEGPPGGGHHTGAPQGVLEPGGADDTLATRPSHSRVVSVGFEAVDLGVAQGGSTFSHKVSGQRRIWREGKEALLLTAN